MLVDDSFLERGAPWPPPSESARLKKYRANRLLFDSKADEVYGRWVSLLTATNGDVLEETHYVLSFHRRLSFLWADLVAGEAPVFGATEDSGAEVVRNTADAVRFGITLQEAVIDTSRYGDTIFRLSRLDDGVVRIRPVSPEFWFPVVDPSDVRSIAQHVLARTFNRGEEKYLKAEVHHPDAVEHRLYGIEGQNITSRLRGSSARALFPAWRDSEPLPPGVEGPLLVHAPGARTSEKLHGLDDYTAIDSKMEYLMWLMAQRQGILHKHLGPSIAGPPGQIATLETGEEVYISGSRYFEIDDPKSTIVPQYITWDPRLDASFQQTNAAWNDIYLTSETSPAAFGHSETGYAESGTSLKLRMVAPLKKAARIQERFDDPVKRVLSLACALGGTPGVEPRIEWKDGLPDDPKENVELETALYEAGMTSLTSALKRLHGYTDEQAREEIDRIAEEKLSLGDGDPLRALSRQLTASRGGGNGSAFAAEENGAQAR